MQWYQQTPIWAVIISVGALVLSQLPPILSWIPRNDIKVEVGSRIGLPNDIGVSGYTIILDLENNGNRSLTISNIHLEVVSPNGTIKRVPADSYFRYASGQSDLQYYSITSVKLSAGGEWSEAVSFYPTASPSDEEEIYRIKSEISKSINSKFRLLPANQYNSNVILEADERFVTDAMNFFKRRFDLEKGNYKAALICDVDGRKVTLKKFEFTLFDYHIGAVKAQTEDFKYGYGIYLPTVSTKTVNAPISKVE